MSRLLTTPVLAVCTLFASIMVGKLGYFQPFLIVGSILQTVGVGLYYTFGLNTGLGPIVGYQIIFGVGTGLGIQTCIIVGQMLSSMEDMSMTMATIICKWSPPTLRDSHCPA